MIVKIFPKTATEFESLGLGALSPSSCIVKREKNGGYELELSHPYDEWGKWRRLEAGCILAASTPDGVQPFRIYNLIPSMDGIQCTARHIFFDLLDNECAPIDFSGTAAGALATIKGALAYPMPFDFVTDITLSGVVKGNRCNPVSMLLSDEDGMTSFLKGFGGEIDMDGFRVSLNASIGSDRDVSIRYGKNLTGLEVNQNDEEVRTRIHYIGRNGDGIIDSPFLSSYPYPKIYTLEDKEKTVDELRIQAEELLAAGIDVPAVNIKVNFVELSKTLEYAGYAPLEDVHLGDIVTIINSKMGFSKRARVISYKWNSLLDKYEEIELGDFLPTLAASVINISNSASISAAASATAAGVAALLDSHLKDFNNPHKVTAAQTGGGGGGYGLYTFEVDENGDLWLYYEEGQDVPDFEYDDENGNLYVLIEG